MKGREPYRAALWDAMKRYGITDKNEIAALLATVSVETGDLRWVEEIASGVKYNGRKDLGNTQPGDGPRFKGRGIIQLTGRANYQAFSKQLNRPDIMQDPTIVARDPYLAAESAMYYWTRTKGLREAAKRGDIRRVSQIVNGGPGFHGTPNHMDQRAARFRDYLNGKGKLWGGGSTGETGKEPQSNPKQPGEKEKKQNGSPATAMDPRLMKGGMDAGVDPKTGSYLGAKKNDQDKKPAGLGSSGSLTKAIEQAEGSGSVASGNSATPWMEVARSYLGCNEKDHNAKVTQMHKVCGLRAGGETPWCASFVSYILEKVGIRSTKSARAFSYDKWGNAAPAGTYPYGAIITWKFSHVSFCAGVEGNMVLSLGGNQSSRKGGSQRNGGEVTISRIPMSKVKSVRLPPGYNGKAQGNMSAKGAGNPTAPKGAGARANAAYAKEEANKEQLNETYSQREEQEAPVAKQSNMSKLMSHAASGASIGSAAAQRSQVEMAMGNQDPSGAPGFVNPNDFLGYGTTQMNRRDVALTQQGLHRQQHHQEERVVGVLTKSLEVQEKTLSVLTEMSKDIKVMSKQSPAQTANTGQAPTNTATNKDISQMASQYQDRNLNKKAPNMTPLSMAKSNLVTT